MVFLSMVNFARGGAPRFWRAQFYRRLAAKYYNRTRNCYQLSTRIVHRSLMKATLARRLKKINYKKLWEQRIFAASMEHGVPKDLFLEGLSRCHIQLDRKVLNDIAIYEPRTFQSLVEISKAKLETEGLSTAEIPKAKGIITRDML